VKYEKGAKLKESFSESVNAHAIGRGINV